MIHDLLTAGVREKFWGTVKSLLGEPPELARARASLDVLRREHEERGKKDAARLAGLEQELEQLREERLKWIAKESSTRKEFNECQERSKELLEQVVRLTHQERLTKQTLFDQQFKTATTPLERNRFEMELVDARAKVKQADERAKRAEEKVARLKELEDQMRRMKQLESELAWVKGQAEAHQRALAAAVARVQELEAQIPARPKKKKPERTAKSKPARQSYRTPDIRRAADVQRKTFSRSSS